MQINPFKIFIISVSIIFFVAVFMNSKPDYETYYSVVITGENFYNGKTTILKKYFINTSFLSDKKRGSSDYKNTKEPDSNRRDHYSKDNYRSAQDKRSYKGFIITGIILVVFVVLAYAIALRSKKNK
jgi:flagellar biosynthesis/type III secretory pathway M-ring protein FliF/YscJ